MNNSILGLLLAVYSHIQSNLEGQHDNNCFKKITSAYIFTSEFISCIVVDHNHHNFFFKISSSDSLGVCGVVHNHSFSNVLVFLGTVLQEIEDRKSFLDEMEALGEGKKYRTIIMTEISQVN